MKLVIILVLAAVAVASAKWVDLTYALNKDVVVWPGRKLSFNTEFEGEVPGVGWVASRGFCISEHTSTHIDAPYHFNKVGWTLNDLSLESLLDVPGVLIDIYDKVHVIENGKLKTRDNYVLTRDDLLEWEQANGQIPPKSLVLVRTGWGKKWNNADDYQGIPEEFRTTTTTAKPGEEPTKDDAAPTIDLEAGKRLNFPGFDASAAKFLSSERNVYGVGIDTLSIDAGSSSPIKYLQSAIFTCWKNVANTHLLPAKGFRLWAVPFKVDAGTGSPTRLLAKLNGLRNKIFLLYTLTKMIDLFSVTAELADD